MRWAIGAVVAVALVGGAVALADPDEHEAAAPRHGVAGATAVSTATASSPAPPGGSCGAASTRTIAAVDAQVARRIYKGELAGHEVARDVTHVTGSAELASAVAGSEGAAVYAAVHTIVYTPHWHIVRLRVVKDGRVLADVGGPYIIAPITGALRENGVKVGSFVMSVQDDVGYVKLVTRFTGVPIDLYGGPPPRPANAFLMGTLQPAPPLPSNGSMVDVAGRTYLARVAQAAALPSGKLSVALLVPQPARSLASQSCAAVRNAAWGAIVEHVAARYRSLPTQYQSFIGTLAGSTGGVAYVREGSRQIAGLNLGPRHLPTHGKVVYRGRAWQVFSWSPHPPARIYFLAPS